MIMVKDINYGRDGVGVLTITLDTQESITPVTPEPITPVTPEPNKCKIVLTPVQVSKLRKSLKAGENSWLDYFRIVGVYVLVAGGIGTVCLLAKAALNTQSTNVGFIIAAMSATVALVGTIAGHTIASVGREKSQQQVIEASKSSE